MHTAVSQAGVVNQVGFVFRKWPAMALARQLVEAGELGEILHFRGHYFHDYALDPALDMGWRVQRATAGAGSIGDLGSHLIDLARYIVGEVGRVHARSRVIWPRRPMVGSDAVLVDVDDASDILLEFESGATGLLQTNWMAAGYKTDIAFEALGDKGSLRFTWRRNGELQFYSHRDPTRLQGFRTIHVGPEHPGAERFWPVAGQGLGYGDAFTILIGELLRCVQHQVPAAPSFLDGLRAAEIVDAAQQSSTERAWVSLPTHSD
jgi:predicted dehydrogenase